jgi:PAS domain S-box-containing protein
MKPEKVLVSLIEKHWPQGSWNQDEHVKKFVLDFFEEIELAKKRSNLDKPWKLVSSEHAREKALWMKYIEELEKFTEFSPEQVKGVIEEGRLQKLVHGLNQKLIELQKETTKAQVDKQRLELLLGFVENSNDAFQVSNEEGQLMYINKEASHRLGISQEAAHLYHVRDFEEIFKEEGTWERHVDELKNMDSMVIEGVNKNQKTGTTFPVEVTVRHYQIRPGIHHCLFTRNHREKTISTGNHLSKRKGRGCQQSQITVSGQHEP